MRTIFMLIQKLIFFSRMLRDSTPRYIWAPNASESSFLALHRIQNQALHIATGCHSITSIDHLHNEAEVMPVEPHIEMLNQQFLVNTLKPSYPLHAIVTVPYSPRKMKATLHSKYASSINQHLSNGSAQYSSILKNIHTSAVATSINHRVSALILSSAPALRAFLHLCGGCRGHSARLGRN